jgi:hypothetical protein
VDHDATCFVHVAVPVFDVFWYQRAACPNPLAVLNASYEPVNVFAAENAAFVVDVELHVKISDTAEHSDMLKPTVSASGMML